MKMGMNTMSFNSGGGAGSPYSTETQAYLAAIPNNTYSDAEKLALDTFIVGMKTDGIWAKLDQLFLLCAKSSVEAESRVNLIYPTYPANATPSADPKRAISKITAGGNQLVWTSGQGYVTTSGAEKLSGMYTPDGNNQFKVQDSHVMIYCQDNVAGKDAGAAIGGNASTIRYQLVPRNTSDNAVSRFGSATTRSGSNATTMGLYIMTMIAADQFRVYKNGSAIISSDASAQSVLPSDPIALLYYYSATSSYYEGKIGAHSVGGGLTEALATAYYNRLDALFTACGAK